MLCIVVILLHIFAHPHFYRVHSIYFALLPLKTKTLRNEKNSNGNA